MAIDIYIISHSYNHHRHRRELCQWKRDHLRVRRNDINDKPYHNKVIAIAHVGTQGGGANSTLALSEGLEAQSNRISPIRYTLKTNLMSTIPGERTTHSYEGALYILPSDEEERQRLVAQHDLYTRLLSGRLIFPPVSLSSNDEVLDIGTGAGTWLCDVRPKLPESVQLYGIDIESRLFPHASSLSPNTHLSVRSATDMPPHWSSKFKLINQRLLLCAYTRDQWLKVINEMYRVLVPGGYVQLVEVGPEWDSGPKTAAHMLFIDEFMGAKGMVPRIGVYLPDMLKAAGFTNVKSEKVMMKMGKWAGEEGIEARDINISAWRAMKGAVIKAGGMGRYASPEDVEKFACEMAEEWDNTEGSHTTVGVFYGRKPL